MRRCVLHGSATEPSSWHFCKSVKAPPLAGQRPGLENPSCHRLRPPTRKLKALQPAGFILDKRARAMLLPPDD